MLSTIFFLFVTSSIRSHSIGGHTLTLAERYTPISFGGNEPSSTEPWGCCVWMPRASSKDLLHLFGSIRIAKRIFQMMCVAPIPVDGKGRECGSLNVSLEISPMRTPPDRSMANHWERHRFRIALRALISDFALLGFCALQFECHYS